ncbi:MAG: right-handed parallel beta-helix repeat-containing protein [Pirellula sp.]
MRELTGFAEAKLRWQGPGIAKQVVSRNSLGTFSGFTNTDKGLDDSFVVSSASTTIDAGDYSFAYHFEPMPNGDRINIGSTGNTPDAASRIGPQLYVVDLNGLEKIPTSSNTILRWQSSGLTANRPVMLVNLGSSSRVDNFQADDVRVEGVVQANGAIDTSGIASAAPAAVYTSAVRTTGGIGTKAVFHLPVSDGNYTLRLHFASVFGAGVTLNVVVNGVTLATNYDPFVAAGGINRAAVLPLGVSVNGGAGLRLEIVANAVFGALIHGLELSTPNTIGVADPRVDLQWSGDGTVWNTIATNQPMDRFGRGQFNWSVPANLPLGNNYRVRAISSPTTPSAMDQSDKPFEIVGSGTNYYVNNSSLANDVYTTAIGNDSNSGKSPSQPMSSLENLFRSYDLNPGDTIYVDSGIHTLTRDLTITNEDSGVRIVGPSDRSAIFQRTGTASSSNAVFRLSNADGITFENVEIQGGGGYGIHAPFANGSAGSDGLTIRNSRFINLLIGGVYLDQGNNFATIEDSVFDGGVSRNMGIHLYLLGTNSSVTNSLFTKYFGSGSGTYSVYVYGGNSIVDGNQFIDNNTGSLSVRGGGTPETASRASNNIVRDSVGNGIEAGVSAVVENNQVYNMGVFGNLSSPLAGIRGTGTFQNNLIHSTQVGMVISGGTATGNTIYNTVQAGVWTGGTVTLSNNRIYSNPLGVRVYNVSGGGSGNDNPLLTNNLIYSNGTGIQLDGTSIRLENNTIYQTAGNAVITTVGNESFNLENNIISVDAGSILSMPNGIGSVTGNYNLYHVRGAGRIASLLGVNYTDLATWSYAQNMDADSLAVDPQFVDIDGTDNTLGYTTANFGSDDNFRVLSTSPSIDRGNPNAIYAVEPEPNGNRVNIGSYGNTSDATSSATELVQILSPNGYEKFEVGQSQIVTFQSGGLSAARPVAQLAAGVNSADRWSSAQAFQLTGSRSGNASVINLSQVTDPAPQSVYQGHAGIDGIGAALQFQVPVTNGTYNVRLHFVEPNVPAGSRRFDIQLQGITVAPNFDIRAAAGAFNTAITRSYSGIAVSNGLLDLRMLNLTSNGAIVSVIEITADEPVADPTPTVTLQYSSNNGTSWSTVATNVPLDTYGRGQFVWTPTTPTNSRTSLFRIVSEQGLFATDTSDQAFEVVNNGPEYYISLTGNDANGGKTPDRPMRNLSAVIQSFDLDAGDRINVGAGTYLLHSNIVIHGQDSGITIQGPTGATAIFDRQQSNSIPSQFAFELQNADNVTIDSVSIKNADSGVYSGNTSDSDDFVIRNSRIFGNSYAGIEIGPTNDRMIAQNNILFGVPGGSTLDDQQFGFAMETGIFIGGFGSGFNHLLEDNEVFDHGNTGIHTAGRNAIVRNNEVHGNLTGIRARGDTEAQQSLVVGNEVFANTTTGITTNGFVLTEDNEVYGQTSTNQFGIVASGGTVRNNIVRNNANGISASSNSASSVQGNRVFGNTNVGISVNFQTEVNSNRVYSNSHGIQGLSSYSGMIVNNIVYANTNRGVQLSNVNASSVVLVANNTIYQQVGEAIRLDGSSKADLNNNIVWILSGYGISAGTLNANDFRSNYNLLHRSSDPNARIGFWNANQLSLLDWQLGSGHDVNSVSSDPLFVDIDGADNIFGYNSTSSIDGGSDDNFYLKQFSPAIDRGDSWRQIKPDIEGFAASDDPATANMGRNTLQPTVLSNNQFTATGTAQGFRSNNQSFAYNFTGGFVFPFYGINYTSVFVSTEGFLQFGSQTNAGDSTNTLSELLEFPRIAALWDNIRTNAVAADNVFVETGAGFVKIRWDATNELNNEDVQFSITLFNNGEVQFDYGPIAGGSSNVNTGLTPTVGISSGNGYVHELVPAYDNATNLNQLNSVRFSFVPGIRDIGAFEYRGNSSDTSSPVITSSVPSTVANGGITAAAISEIGLVTNESLQPLSTVSPTLYELRNAGTNNQFGDSDDVLVPVVPAFNTLTNTLNLSFPGGPLSSGLYRLTVLSTPLSSAYDLSGNRLDGDNDGNAGGNYVRTFRVISNAAPILVGDYSFASIDEDIAIAANLGTLVSSVLAGRWSDADGPSSGIAISGVDNSNGVWQYTLDGTAYSSISPSLAGGSLLLLGSTTTARIRFLPNANYFGNAGGISYRAWDRADQTVVGTAVQPGTLQANSLSSNTYISTILVDSVNDAPIDITSTLLSIVENSPINSVVGTFQTVDVESGGTFVYSLEDGVGSDDNTSFYILNNALHANVPLDADTKNSYSVRVRSTDSGGLQIEEAFVVTIENVNEAPLLSRTLSAVSGNVLTTLTNSGAWSDPENANVDLSVSTGSITKNLNGTWTWSWTPTAKVTDLPVTVTATDGVNSSQVSFLVTSNVVVAGRSIYYKGSDYSNSGANIPAALDSSPVNKLLRATDDPQPLTTDNVINYGLGLNGIVLDVAGLVSSSLSLSDFTFRTGGTNNPSGWGLGPNPNLIHVTPGNATTPARVRLEWPNNAIQNTWLQIIVHANANTGLAQREVYYVGHAMAEISGGGPSLRVTAADLSSVQSAISNQIVSVNDLRDINKDRRVTAADLSAVQSRISNTVLLTLFTVPAKGSSGEGESNRAASMQSMFSAVATPTHAIEKPVTNPHELLATGLMPNWEAWLSSVNSRSAQSVNGACSEVDKALAQFDESEEWPHSDFASRKQSANVDVTSYATSDESKPLHSPVDEWFAALGEAKGVRSSRLVRR